jgi:hypothetical protein
VSFSPETYTALGAALVGCVWVLASRLKKAKRIMPRMRFRTHFSLETPRSDPPPAEQLEDIDVQIIEPDEGTAREALSDRPTNPPSRATPPERPRAPRRRS